ETGAGGLRRAEPGGGWRCRGQCLGTRRAQAAGRGPWPPLLGSARLAVHRQCSHDRLGGGGALRRRDGGRAGGSGKGALAARSRGREGQGRGGEGMSFERLAVIGGGAWGTALAQVAATGGRETLLWALEDDVVTAVNEVHENPVYLQGVSLGPAIRATSNFADLSEADAWLVVTPAQHMRAVLGRSPCPNMPLILCSKGIEERTGKLLHEMVHEICPSSPIAVLSGPTFAHEVAAGLPTAVTLACE